MQDESSGWRWSAIGDGEVLTSDVIAEDPRRDDVATGAEEPFQVRLVNIMRIVLAIIQFIREAINLKK